MHSDVSTEEKLQPFGNGTIDKNIIVDEGIDVRNNEEEEEEDDEEIGKVEEKDDIDILIQNAMEEKSFDPYYNRQQALDAMKEEMKNMNLNPSNSKSLATSKAAKKKFLDLIQDEFDHEEKKLPPPRPVHPLHVRLYKGIKRRLYKLPPEVPPLRSEIDIDGFMNAASRDRFTYIMQKVEYEGYPIDIIDDFNRTALWYSALNGCDSTTGFLLSKSNILPLVDLKDTPQGWTPLAACSTGRGDLQIQTATRLLRAKANIDVRDIRGRTPLMLAIISDNLEIAETLIEYGASLDRRDKATWMPLHHATFDENEDAVELLLKSGCKYKRKDQLKMRAIDWAERKGFIEIADIITKWGENDYTTKK